ncbi:Cation channel sperm-associated protein 1 [Durusdinium trenchii]|uniref:Cation channel sperm-associated protein 1 n=1 Tax=Durusdinium trenchii TaxID=1381693 RepID=A0ABP0LS74_9DINO
MRLVEGVARLKGPAKSMDLAVFKLDFLKFKEDVGKIAELVEKLSGETVAGEGFATAHRCTRKSVLKE